MYFRGSLPVIGYRPNPCNKETQLRNEWEKAKRIEVWKGDNNALMMKRIGAAE